MMSRAPRAPILVCCLAVALVALLVRLQQDTLLMYGLGLISVGIVVSWAFCAVVSHEHDKLDEADKYEIGADAGGVFIVFATGLLSLLWLAVCATILVGRAMWQEQPLFTADLLWQLKAFAVAECLGILLLVTNGWWLSSRTTQTEE